MARYIYTIDGIPRTPANAGDLVINETRFNEGGGWFMRKQLSSDIKFRGVDRKYFKSQTDLCRYFEFKIYKQFKFVKELIYSGRFSLLNCSFNDDLCEVSISIETLDQYTCLLQNWDKELNVAQITDTNTIWEVENKRLIQFGIGIGTSSSLPTFVFSLDGSSDPADYGDFIEEFSDNFTQNLPGFPGFIDAEYITYCRELIYTACVDGVPQEPNGTGWTLESACSATTGGFGFSLWWRRYDYLADGLTFESPFVTGPTNPYPYAVSKQNPSVAPVGFSFCGIQNDLGTDFDVYFLDSILEDYKTILRSRYVKGGRDLLEVGTSLLNNACGAGHSISSEFFTNATNPVTGTVNICKDLQLWTKSDVANAQLTEALATANIQAADKRLTTREYFEDLQIHFNTEWKIDAATPKTVVLEHISDIRPNAIDLDLTTLDSGVYLVNKNSYDFAIEDVPIQEQWRFITASLPDFVGVPIDYNGCGNNIIDYNTSQIDTELDVLIGDAEQRSLDGFILVQTDSIKSTDSLSQTGIFWAFFAPNMPLSISNLHEKFWPYVRKLPEGKINGVNQTFVSYQNLLRQNELAFKLCDPNSFDRNKLVRTQYGDCEIVSTSYNLTTEIITFLTTALLCLFFLKNVKRSDVSEDIVFLIGLLFCVVTICALGAGIIELILKTFPL